MLLKHQGITNFNCGGDCAIHRTILYEGNEYIVVGNFLQPVWAYREVGDGLIDLYRNAIGAVVIERLPVELLNLVIGDIESQRDIASMEVLKVLDLGLDSAIEEGG